MTCLRPGGPLASRNPRTASLGMAPWPACGTTHSCAAGIVLNISTACSGVTMSPSPMMSSVGAAIRRSSSCVKCGSTVHIGFRRPRRTGQCSGPSGRQSGIGRVDRHRRRVERPDPFVVLGRVAVDSGIRAGRDKPGDACRVTDGHVKADDPAVAVADDDGALDLELAQELDRVLGQVEIVERAVHRVGCPPVAHELSRDDPEPRRECGIHVSGIEPVPAVQQQQREARPRGPRSTSSVR